MNEREVPSICDERLNDCASAEMAEMRGRCRVFDGGTSDSFRFAEWVSAKRECVGERKKRNKNQLAFILQIRNPRIKKRSKQRARRLNAQEKRAQKPFNNSMEEIQPESRDTTHQRSNKPKNSRKQGSQKKEASAVITNITAKSQNAVGGVGNPTPCCVRIAR